MINNGRFSEEQLKTKIIYREGGAKSSIIYDCKEM